MKAPRVAFALLSGMFFGTLPWILISVAMFGGGADDWHWIVAVGTVPAAFSGAILSMIFLRYRSLGGPHHASISAGPIVGFLGTIVISSATQLPRIGSEEYQRLAVAGITQAFLDIVGGVVVLLIATGVENLRGSRTRKSRQTDKRD